MASTPVKLAVAALLAAVPVTAGLVRAAAPTPVAPVMMATENADTYLEHLRSARKSMGTAYDLLKKQEMADRADHRKKSIESLKKSMDELDEEIATYEKDTKNGKGG